MKEKWIKKYLLGWGTVAWLLFIWSLLWHRSPPPHDKESAGARAHRVPRLCFRGSKIECWCQRIPVLLTSVWLLSESASLWQWWDSSTNDENKAHIILYIYEQIRSLIYRLRSFSRKSAKILGRSKLLWFRYRKVHNLGLACHCVQSSPTYRTWFRYSKTLRYSKGHLLLFH